CRSCGADALVRSRPLVGLVRFCRCLILRQNSGTRASRADQGSAPRDIRRIPGLGKLSGIRLESPPPLAFLREEPAQQFDTLCREHALYNLDAMIQKLRIRNLKFAAHTTEA